MFFASFNTDRGFTLIELLVVVAILTVLGAVILPNMIKVVDKGKASAAIADYNTIKAAVVNFYFEKSCWPDSLEDLVDEKYIDKISKNPWNKAYELNITQEDIALEINEVPIHSAKEIDKSIDGECNSTEGMVSYDSLGGNTDVTIIIANIGF